MNDLIVKSVDVLGDAIMAVKNEDGYVYAGVSYFCTALGMSRGQKNRQVANVQTDETLKHGCIKLGAGVLDEGNEAIALRIDFIPLWLAKISITQKTREERPDFAKKLLEYQLQAKDILAEAFLSKYDAQPLSLQQQIQTIAQGTTELYERIDGLEERFTSFEKSLPLLPNEADEVSNAVKKRVLEVLGGKESQAYKNRGICQKAFKDAYSQLKRNFGDIKRYKDIKREQKEQAVIIAGRYEPPLYLKELITEANAQMTMGSAL